MKNRAKIIVWLVSGIVLCTTFGCAPLPYGNGQLGALIGAGGGALVGQAIGRDTGSTLIGAGVGTMLGYMFGNEQDKFMMGQQQSVYPSHQPYQSYGGNPGVESSYQRGIADRRHEIQRQMERDAYDRGRYYGR